MRWRVAASSGGHVPARERMHLKNSFQLQHQCGHACARTAADVDGATADGGRESVRGGGLGAWEIG